MRPRLALPAFALLLLAVPAGATGGFECRATDGSGLGISGTIGHVIGSPLVGARLETRASSWATSDPEPRVAIGRSWIDERELRIDLVDPQATRFEARLRARIGRRDRAAGTLVHAGRTHPVRCTLE